MRKLVMIIAAAYSVYGDAARLKDLANLRGQRNNQLIGYGMVVGLQGTGDKTSELTENSFGLALKGLGVDVKTGKLETKNMAAVLVTALLPPFARQGAHLDVTVSSVASATSLDGGTLVLTALRAADGNVYAMSQGKIVTTVRRLENNQRPTGQTLVTASVPAGAILEKELGLDFANQRELKYQLLSPDFTTAARVALKINEELGGKYAVAEDAGSVNVVVPYNFEGNPVDFVARIESLDIEADRRARIVINQRTGTVILGEAVRLAPVAISHGNLKIEVKDPAKADAKNAKRLPIAVLEKGASVADIAAGLNEMGGNPDDFIALLQALKASGSLVAELEIQ